MPEHRIGLTWACLTVRKQSRVLAIQKSFNMSSCYRTVDLRLKSCGCEHSIKWIPIFTVIDHSVIVVKRSWMSGRPKPTVDSNILPFFGDGSGLIWAVLVNGGLDEGVWQFDGDFGDWTAEGVTFLWGVEWWGCEGGELILWELHVFVKQSI